MINHAQSLAAFGWQIFPAPVGTKKSHVKARDGQARWGATSEVATLAGYWQQWPSANIGVACGPVSGVWCLDIDTTDGHDHDGHASLRALLDQHGPLPHTVASVSPSGSMHFYFRWPTKGEPIRNSAGRVAPGIDVRGEGGMVIAPPSVKLDGQAYQWQVGCDPWSVAVAHAPEWLLSAVRAAAARATPAMPRPAGTGNLAEIRELLTHIDPDADGYDGWFSIVAGIHEATGGSEDGLALADEWSQRSAKYDPAELADKYASGLRAGSGGYNMGTIAAAAGRAGANLAEIGQRHRIASMAASLGSYRPAGMTDAPSMPRPSIPSGAGPVMPVPNAPTAAASPVDPVTLLVDIIQPDPSGNLPLIVEEAARLSAASFNTLKHRLRPFGIVQALTEAVKEHRRAARRAETEQAGMIADANGIPIPNLENVRRIMLSAPAWSGTYSMNEFDGQVWVKRPELRPATDGDFLVATGNLQASVFPSISPTTVRDGITTAAMDAPFHPVRDYLTGLRWDGTPRLHTLFTDYFPCEVHPDSEIPGHAAYVAAAGQRFCIGAVARIMSPGAKVDTMPTLSGAQGLKKSTGVATLCGSDWYGEDMPDMTEKDAKQWLRGRWVAEIAELAAMKGKDVEHVKNFLSTATDKYRAPYGRTVEVVPRQTVFVGTVNGDDYLADSTGGRRFWPLRVVAPVDLHRVAADRDQLWAEAVVLHAAGWRWWFDQGESPALEYMQEDVRIVDLDETRVAEWLRYTPGEVTPQQIATALFENERGDRSLSMRIARYMKSLGWTYVRKSHGTRYWGRTASAAPYQEPKLMGNVTPLHKLPVPAK